MSHSRKATTLKNRSKLLAALLLAFTTLPALVTAPAFAEPVAQPSTLFGADQTLLDSTTNTVGTASTYYVDCSALVNGTGTQALPLNSVPAANALALQPGDAIAFNRGTTCNGQLHPKYSGTATAQITYGAYGTGAKPHIEANGNFSAIWIYNAAYVTVQDLELSAIGDNTTARRGVWLQGKDAGDLPGIVLQRLNIHDVRGVLPSATGGVIANGKYSNASGGIIAEALGTATPTEFPGLLIQNNRISSVDREGIYTWSNWCMRPDLVGFWSGSLCTAAWHPITNTIIENNLLTDIGGDGIAPMTVTGTLVDHNTLTGFNVRSGSPNAGMWSANSDDVVFQHNDTSGGVSTQDGMAYDVDHSSNRMVFQYNRSMNNAGGFFLICPYGNNVPGESHDFIIRYNLSVNDHARTFQICSGGAKNGKIYNNTIYVPETGSGTHYAVLQPTSASIGADQLAFSNNIWLRHTTALPITWTTHDPANITSDHDLFYNVPATPGAVNSFLTAPLLAQPTATQTDVTKFKPNTNSPVLNAGLVLPGAPANDFFGTPIGSTPSLGFSQTP